MTPPDDVPEVRITYRPPASMRGSRFMIAGAEPETPAAPAPSAAPAPKAAAMPQPVEIAPSALPIAKAAAAKAPLAKLQAERSAPRLAVAGSAEGLIPVGLDLGRSEVRVFDGERLYTFPTLVGGPVPTIRRGAGTVLDENLEYNLHIKLGPFEYSIGRYAMEQPFLFPMNDENIIEDEFNKALFLAALGLLVKRAGHAGVPRFKVCLGLPVYLGRRAEYVEQALAGWLGRQEFVFCGEPMAVEIVQIDTLPQPMGAVYAAIVNGTLDYSPEENIGVIDPGHLTTDWLVARLPNELTQYSGHTTAFSGHRLYEAIGSFLQEQGVGRLDPIGIQESLVSGVYTDTTGAVVPLPEGLIDTVKATMAQQLALTVKQGWRDLRIHRMLLVGGFGQLLYPLLTQFPYFKDLALAEDPRHTNVKGFYEYACAAPLLTGSPA